MALTKRQPAEKLFPCSSERESAQTSPGNNNKIGADSGRLLLSPILQRMLWIVWFFLAGRGQQHFISLFLIH